MTKCEERIVKGESRDGLRSERAWILRKLGSCCRWMGVGLVVYVLSVGPVVKFSLKGPIPEEVVEIVYAPFEWIFPNETVRKMVEPFIEWYGEEVWGWSIF